MMSTSRRSTGGGAELWGSVGLLVLSKQGSLRLVVALLLVVISTIADHGHCITPAPAPAAGVSSDTTQEQPNVFSFDPVDAEALTAVYRNWSALNPELSTVLNWTSVPSTHPCNNSDLLNNYSIDASPFKFDGAWGGVSCTAIRSDRAAKDYDVSVTRLVVIGSNLHCKEIGGKGCYNFTGIDGVLPPAISGLGNLTYLSISHHPKLTGPIPPEIWQMPKLQSLVLRNNSLVDTLPSHVPNASSTLTLINLSRNNLTGELQVRPDGTLFGLPNLTDLDLGNNQLDGPLDFQRLVATSILFNVNLGYNRFSGTFSIGPYFNPTALCLSVNNITDVKFASYNGTRLEDSTWLEGSVVYMPELQYLYVDRNNLSGPFPMEVMQMPSLLMLDLSVNNLHGSVDFSDNSRIDFAHIGLARNGFRKIWNISFNNFYDTFSWGPYLDVAIMDFSGNQFKKFTFETYNGTNDIMPSLRELYMRNNNLSGDFPSEILRAPSLDALYGDHNQYKRLRLPDDVPTENATLNNIVLTHNKFDDVTFAKSGLFTNYFLQVSNILFLDGNPYCEHIGSELLAKICRPNRTSRTLMIAVSHSSFKNRIIIGTCTSAAIIFLMVSMYVWKLMHRIASLHNILAEFEKKEVKPNLYSYREIKLATMNFDKRNKLGEGGFGVVYKGELFDGTIVAVKKLTMSSSQGLSEFLNEVVVISGLKHRNLVKLKGCCLGDGDQRMLVFEYVENKNLGEALWVEGILRPSQLNWNTRFNIIIGTARGLAYLHEELQSPVIHRDIKAANILLDKDYNPKIADFGLAFLFPVLSDEDTHLTLVEIAGTRGYCSPEYVLHGHISTALDVYSFGIMTLEVVSGRRNINLQKSSGEVYLRDWAWTQFEAHALTMLIDSNMEHTSLDLEAITRVINVALACVQYMATKRPKMHDVVSMLLGNMPIGKFSKDNEYTTSGGVASSFTTRSNTTSFGENINPDLDECSLLHNTNEIEMSVKC